MSLQPAQKLRSSTTMLESAMVRKKFLTFLACATNCAQCTGSAASDCTECMLGFDNSAPATDCTTTTCADANC